MSRDLTRPQRRPEPVDYVVSSDRLKWDRGTRLSIDDLAGCNIVALLAGGHLSAVTKKIEAVESPQETD